MTPRAATIAATLTLLVFAQPAVGHGSAEASELEVEVLRDDGNDLQGPFGGWDVTQVFLGEAHSRALGFGPAGDAVYWRAELYGVPGSSPSPLAAAGEWRAVFSFDAPEGTITRSLASTDGKSFQHDFDALETETEDGILRVQRAAIRLDGADLNVGDALTNFRVETYVGDQLRDRAPGGIPLAGPAEVPMPSETLVEEYALTGPSRYATAEVVAQGGGFELRVTSLLTEGEQHIDVHLPAALSTNDPTSVSVKARETAVFVLAPTDAAGEETAFDVTTDVGGRLTLLVEKKDGATTLRVLGAEDAAETPAAQLKTPAAPWILAVLVAALVLGARRR